MGTVLLILAILLLLPLAVALMYKESPLPFLFTIMILLAASLPAVLLTKGAFDKKIYAKEGFVGVALSWIVISLVGALPFVFSGAIPNYIDAVFETVSGFTTTGATILTAIEGLPMGILFFRSFTHWIGGMGVLVFILAVLPINGSTIHILRAEVPGPTKGKLVPKLRQTALILYGIYVALTMIETVALLIAGLDLYNATVTAFSTLGTGGFSVMNDSIAGYANPAVEWIVAAFMLLAGINFNIYFYLLIRSFKPILKNTEIKVYLTICILASSAITLNLWFSGVHNGSFGDTVRQAFFQVTSIMSTTGFASLDYAIWPNLSQTLLLLLTFIGACAGSTAGGLKISRLVIIFKSMKNQIRKMLKPNSVDSIKMDGEILSDDLARSSLSYFAFYCAIIITTMLAISVDGLDPLTNFTAAVTCFNNVGPGLGAVIGPAGNFSSFSDFSTVMLSLSMLLGRLEVFPILILFSPSTWKKT